MKYGVCNYITFTVFSSFRRFMTNNILYSSLIKIYYPDINYDIKKKNPMKFVSKKTTLNKFMCFKSNRILLHCDTLGIVKA